MYIMKKAFVFIFLLIVSAVSYSQTTPVPVDSLAGNWVLAGVQTQAFDKGTGVLLQEKSITGKEGMQQLNGIIAFRLQLRRGRFKMETPAGVGALIGTYEAGNGKLLFTQSQPGVQPGVAGKHSLPDLVLSYNLTADGELLASRHFFYKDPASGKDAEVVYSFRYIKTSGNN